MTIPSLDSSEHARRVRRLTLAGFATELSGGQWQRYRHVEWLAERIQAAARAGGKRIIVNMPPRHGKSELISHWLPAWWLYWNPTTSVTLASYQGDYAAEWSWKVRQEFVEHDLGLRVNRTAKRVKGWSVCGMDASGRRTYGRLYAVGVGGPITGRGSQLIIIDDPTKNWEEAHSTAAKRKLRNWFTSTLMTRCEPGATVILIMTRWADDDLTEWILSQPGGDKWQQIVLPALAEDGDPLGRSSGSSLCPERYDEAALAGIKEQIGAAQFNCLYQQKPMADGSTVFKRLWFQNYYTELPDLSTFDEIFMVGDLTMGSQREDASYAVIDVWGKRGAEEWLLDEWRERADFVTTCQAFRMMSARWPRAERKLVEAQANGPAVIASLEHEIPGIVGINTGGKSKEARAWAVTPNVEAGNIWLPDSERAPWVDDWLEEICSFPNGKRDDRVDTFTYERQHCIDSREGFIQVGVPGKQTNPQQPQQPGAPRFQQTWSALNR